MSVPGAGPIEVADQGPVQDNPAGLCVAYLVNQYPKISHRFIRREIEALENCGVRIERFSLRLCGDRLVDESDRRELKKTRIVLESGLVRMALDCAAAVLFRPVRFGRALRLGLHMGWKSDRGVLVHMAYLVEACVLLRWFTQRQVQHVHAHFATNPAAVAMLCQVLGGPPYSFAVHGPDDFDRARFLGLSEKIARARFVVTVSSYGRSQLYRWCEHRLWPKIHVLHPGIDATFLELPPAPIPRAPKLVCIGRLDEEKGQLVLLEAIKRLVSDGMNLQVVLVGDGPLRTQIQARIRQLSLTEYVLMAGAVPTVELCSHIQSSRAVVLPSLAENLPSVILEAFALQRPVIATFIGGIPELVEPGVNGWLVRASSVEALAQAMREALTIDGEALERMGQAGARRLADGFRSEDSARQLARMFQSERKTDARPEPDFVHQ